MNTEDLIKEAQHRTGLSDFGGGPDVDMWLNLLVRELNLLKHQTLSYLWKKTLVSALSHRLHLAIVQPEVTSLNKTPVLISGFTRSGTTLLHELLAVQPGMRAPTVTEARWPAAASQGGLVAEQAAAETNDYWSMLETLVPRLQDMHEIFPDGPEECRVLLEPSLMSHSFTITWHVPAYTAMLESSSMTPAWEVMLRTLKMLEDDRRWVLKDPSHIFALDELLDVMPAKVVTISRNFVEAVPSSAALMVLAQQATCGTSDPYVGPWVLQKMAADWRHQTKVLRDWPDTLNLKYESFILSPVETIREVTDFLGVEFDLDATEQWLRTHPKDRRGKNRYFSEEYGLTDELIIATMRSVTGVRY